VLPRFPEPGRHTADAAFAFLQRHGILTRKMGGYALPHAIRITVGTGEENEKVAATLAEFMAT
jgi:histidinol-phosphate aminotransferase